jgi:dTMP kinase
MALLFAADRLQHVEHEITPRLEAGDVVLCDRYDGSSIAYQSSALTDEAERARTAQWIAEANSHARRPELTLVLDLDPVEAARRRGARGAPEELYERLDLQRRVREGYRKLPEVRPRDRFEIVDATPPAAEVHAAILRIVLPLVEG